MLIRGHEVFVLPEKNVTLWRYSTRGPKALLTIRA
jgi:hypothetical protein